MAGILPAEQARREGCGALAHLPALMYGSPMRISRILLATILLGLSACAGTIQPAGTQPNELPRNEQIMYGGPERTAEQRAADREYLAAIDEIGWTRREAAEHTTKRGFQYFRRGDYATAIKRFNQAWLLDPEYGGAYWGFAVILFERDKEIGSAGEMFSKAVELLPDDPDLQVDYGRFYGKTARPRKAIERYEQALRLNSNARDAHAGLTSAWVALGDYRQALFHAKISVDRNEYHPKQVVDLLECFVDILDRGDQVNYQTGAKCMSLMQAN
ncbi:MAG: tetratricopeptide repeat protein [Rhodospirillales bacterium]|nr:tetratricopeptide repeat protein [Rhodospirillales bacterium]